MPRLPLSDFLTGPADAPILDVRAPIEYAAGHIPGALSLPLFTDEERARIGTAYKQVSQDKAVLLGLDFFGPKMSTMVKQAGKLAPGKEVRLHCWRGGMRSGAVQWLLELAGFRVHLLDRGYTDFDRLHALERLAKFLVRKKCFFDRDRAAEPLVGRDKDRAHAARADLPLNAIPFL